MNIKDLLEELAGRIGKRDLNANYIIKNPNSYELLELKKDIRKDRIFSGRDDKESYIRYAYSLENDNLYIWDAYAATHSEILRKFRDEKPLLEGFINLKDNTAKGTIIRTIPLNKVNKIKKAFRRIGINISLSGKTS